MNKMFTPVSADEFKKLQFQAGALLKTFDPAGTKQSLPKTASA